MNTLIIVACVLGGIVVGIPIGIFLLDRVMMRMIDGGGWR